MAGDKHADGENRNRPAFGFSWSVFCDFDEIVMIALVSPHNVIG